MPAKDGRIRMFSGRCGASNGVVTLDCRKGSIRLVVQDREARGKRLPAHTVELLRLIASLLSQDRTDEETVTSGDAGIQAVEGGNHLVRAMLAYTRAHFQSPMSLTDVAGALGRNSNYLAHVFATNMNRPFHRYLEDLRMTEAERLLRNGMLTVEEIAASQGFSSADCFRQAFKRRTGLSPLVWSDQHAQVQSNL